MKLKCAVYVSAREYVINKSNKLVYCVKEDSKFSKDISREVISSKVPTNTPLVFQTETTGKQRFHVVATSFQFGIHAVHSWG